MLQHFLPISQKTTLLGGGKVNHAILSECLKRAPSLVAADGAADRALSWGITPDAVVGDMDSVSAQARAQIGADRFYETPDQNHTDFDKALSLLDVPLILAAGFMGKRRDHELSCYNTLVRHPDKSVIMLGKRNLVFHLNSTITISLPLGADFALFPMAEVTVTSTGLKWPADNMVMSPWGRVGTSNIVTQDRVSVRADGPGLLVILPSQHLDAAIAAITA